MQPLGGVIRHLLEADATGAAVLDFDGTDHEYFALMTMAPAAGERIVLAAAGDYGFIDLDQAGQRCAARCHHAAPQLGAQQPSRL
jgi:hypothetical protein